MSTACGGGGGVVMDQRECGRKSRTEIPLTAIDFAKNVDYDSLDDVEGVVSHVEIIQAWRRKFEAALVDERGVREASAAETWREVLKVLVCHSATR